MRQHRTEGQPEGEEKVGRNERTSGVNEKETPPVKSKQLTSEQIASYRRAATRPSVAEQVDGLNTSSLHHEILDLTLGQKTLAVGAEKAWLSKAIRLGATPASTAQEAHLKIGYLQACIDTWVGPNAQLCRHELHVALIVGAIGAEERRWGYPADNVRPN